MMKMLEDHSDDENIFEDLDESDDSVTEDNMEARIESSESEQNYEEFSNDDSTDNASYFLGKDKSSKWYRDIPNKKNRAAPHNLLKQLQGVIGPAKLSKSPVDCWKYLFTGDILDIIVKYTNQYINIIKNKYGRERDAKLTDDIEIKAFRCILYLAGAYRANRQSLEELWGTNGDGVEKFGMVMNLKRFKFLMRWLRFDDRNTRDERKLIDKLAPIREIFYEFVKNFQKCYSLSEFVTLDLTGFRGRCAFKQYIPSKPAKYGTKIYSLVDSKMFYTYNLEIYAGNQPDGPFDISNKPTDVVKRMIAPLRGSDRNLTADNWFTALDFVEELKEMKLSYVGTVKKNNRELPPEFVTTKSREVYSSNFGLH
ncbi:Hypothetical predicted protein [Pelobates cultripes]|uniref:PiggyBac transposable element-derived protein domain-containing protein n=1 Tax=Pelobates cultripes TaxID=61616 RepID=A0AAD1T895_PELCU|nr:Hypothetical predicted protein [Pelobates cultripes]